MTSTKSQDPFIARSAALDFVSILGARLATLAMALATSIMTARALGPAGKGALAVIVLTVAQVTAFASVGADIAIVHHGGRRLVPLRMLAASAVRLAMPLGIGGAVLAVVLLVGPLDEYIAAARGWSVAYALTIPLGLLTLFWQSLIRASGRVVEASLLTAGATALLLMATGIAVAAGWDLNGVVAMNVAAAVAASVLTFGAVLRLGLRLQARSESAVTKSLMRFGLRGHLGTVLQGLNYRLDVFIVGLMLSSTEVGIYSVAVAAAEFLWVIPNSLGLLLLQRSATALPADATRLTALSTRLCAGLTAVVVLAWAVGAPWFLSLLFGSDFESAAGPLRLLLPGIWALAIWKVLANDLSGRGQPQFKSYTASVGLVFTVALDLVLIPDLGLEGAALASSLAYAACAAAVTVVFVRLTHASLRSLFVPTARDLQTLVAAMSSLRGRAPRDGAV